MPGAIIAFDQLRPTSPSYGQPGVARNDLWLSWQVTCRCTTAGNTSFEWEFLDLPPGSAASLASASTANATFTPDLPGSYRVQLTTNGGGPGNVQILIAAAAYDDTGALVNRGWRIPAFGEALSENNFNNNPRGWSPAMEYIFNDLLSFVQMGGGSGGFSDNASAGRTTAFPFIRRNELNDVVLESGRNTATFTDIPTLTDGAAQVGSNLVAMSDKAFFTDGAGQLWGYDLYSGLSYNGPSAPVYTFVETPVDMVGFRGSLPQSGSPDFLQSAEYIFAVMPQSLTARLIMFSTTQLADVHVEYTVDLVATPVRVCVVSGGGDGNNGPVFAITATDGHIYVVDDNGALHDAFDTGDSPGPLFTDDSGFIWVAYESNLQVVKFSLDYSTWTLTVVKVLQGVSPLHDMVSDGRYARGVTYEGEDPLVVIYSWDLQSGIPGPTLRPNLPAAAVPWNQPIATYFDPTTNLVWVGDNESPYLIGYDATTAAVQVQANIATSIPGTAGLSRVIGDGRYLYICSGFYADGDAGVLIVIQATGQPVALLAIEDFAWTNDLALDPDGNLYAVLADSVITEGVVARWNKTTITAAIAAGLGGSPPDPDVLSTTLRAYFSLTYEPVSHTVYAGTFNFSSPPADETLASLDPATLVDVASVSIPTGASSLGAGMGFQDCNSILAAFGSIWVSSDSNTVLRFDPTTFPASGSRTVIAPAASVDTAYLSADLSGGTVLVGDWLSNGFVRIDPSHNTQASFVIDDTLGANAYVLSAVAAGGVLWTATQRFSGGHGIVETFTPPIGSEAVLEKYETFPAISTQLRMAWDGEALCVAVAAAAM
jgi:hypothetical protein